jgi:hypothetical protein
VLAVLSLFGEAIRSRQHARNVLRQLYRLACGRHSVLGNDVKDEVAARGAAAEYLGALRRIGLKRSHRCIEIGCGSLWAAEPVIEYLQPDRYLGLDMTDLFFLSGRNRLPAALLAAKRPSFAVVSAASLAMSRSLQPDFIFSRSTLVHVPPRGLAEFLGQACAMMTRETICVHQTPARPIRTCRFNKYSWVHSFCDVRDALPPGFRVEYREGSYLVRNCAA